MKVIIEARALSAANSGVKTYTQELLKNLTASHTNAEFEILYGSNSPLGSFPSATETVIPLKTEILLPVWMSSVANYVSKKNPSLVHYTKAAIPRKKTVPTVVTIHDIIPLLLPETQSPLRRLYWRHALQYAAIHSDHIMTNSTRSKLDIIDHFGIEKNKVTVTPFAVDLKHFRPIVDGSSPIALATGESLPYILFVGTKDPRKNISSLVRAFARIADQIPHQLVIVGKPAKKRDDSQQIARELHLEHRVQFRENVSYAELPALYSGADIFVWPSLYEGWGFPPQEAMACGTPVIVSDGGPLPEVVGDAGVVVPLSGDTFIERLAHEMLSLMQDEERKKILIARGLEQVKKNTWKQVADETWNVYNKVSL